MKTLGVWSINYLHRTFTQSVLSFTRHISSTFFFVLATIRLRCPWTSTFFRPAGFSLRFKNSSHIFVALQFAKQWSCDTILVFPTAAKSGLAISCFSLLCRSPEEGKMSSVVPFKIFYGDNFERSKMHQMKKERTYQEFACKVLETTKWHHMISVLQTAESQKYYHVTRIFELQTKTNGPWSRQKKSACPRISETDSNRTAQLLLYFTYASPCEL